MASTLSRSLFVVALAALAGCTTSEEPARTRAVSSPYVGSGGIVTIAANTTVNRYTALAANAAAGATTLTVADAATLNPSAGDLLMIVQMQGATLNATDTAAYGTVSALNGAGQYELVTFVSRAGNVLTVDGACGGLRSAYSQAGHTQVIWVPQYQALTVNAGVSITAPPWNGVTGGVVAVQVRDTTTVNGSIDASGAGFRGGATDNSSQAPGTGVTTFRSALAADGAERGEGIGGGATEYDALNGRFGRGAAANGGGGGDSHNAGGGGGANGNSGNAWTGQGVMGAAVTGAAAWALDPGYIANGNALTNSSGGGRGGYTYSANNVNALTAGPGTATWGGDSRLERGGLGGRPVANAPASRLFMGGGGGAGDGNNGGAGAGGRGGGMVLVLSGAVNGAGTIRANGSNGTNTAASGNDAPGGGGAGGTVVIDAASVTGVTLSATGGAGGNQTIAGNEAEGPGGGGGGGYIAVRGGPAGSVAPGSSGTSNSGAVTEFPVNGATDGAPGELATLSGTVPWCLPTDLSLTITDGKTNATPGSATSYTIVVTNTGSNFVRGASVTDTFPAALTSVTWTCAASAGSSCGAASGSGNLATTADLAAGGSATYTVSATISPAATGTLSNTAAVAAPSGVTDPSPANNSATDTTTLTTVADLSVAVIDGPDPVNEASTLTYTVNVTNAGPNDASTVTVSATLPPGVTFVSAAGTGWSCGESGGVVTCTRAALAAGAAPAITVTVTTPRVGASLTSTTTVTGSDTDPVPANNSTTTSTTLNSVNDAPVNTVPGTLTTAEDAPLAFSASTSDVDLAGNPVKITLSATNGTLSLSGVAGLTFSVGDGVDDATMTFTGALAAVNAALTGATFKPALNFNGTATVSLTTDDQGSTGGGGAQTDTDGFSVTVTPLNDSPVAGADSANGSPAVASPIIVLANDTDVDGDTLTVTGVSTPGKGSAVINANGTISYTASPTATGSDSFTYTISDGKGGTATATVTVTIVPGTDTDGDGLSDAAERAIGTDPNDADSDDDGVKDGAEPQLDKDTDGDGLINALDPDSDNDGLFDGTEMGLGCSGAGTDATRGHCRADADNGATKTDPLNRDTDGGGASDGSEDANLDGQINVGETDPTATHGADDATVVDTDGDGLSDKLEATLGSNPNDKDTDDDGVLDGQEPNPSDDTDRDGLVNVLDADSDDDALWDGTEMGKGCSDPATDVSKKRCIADGDNGATKTSPLLRDTDGGGATDGSEDANRNGVLDGGERDPRAGHGADDTGLVDTDGDGLSDALELALGSNPNDKDTDDDGLLDGQENNPAEDTDGDGVIDVLDADSDNDGLFDGTERGKGCSDPATAPRGRCRPDADPTTLTSALLRDTDRGGAGDGSEDPNLDGKVDTGETDPTAGHGADDATVVDTDGDGLSDKLEAVLGSNPNDKDTDDDGVLDGQEPNPSEDTDGDGLRNVLDVDSDDDGLFDGTELGEGCSNPATNTALKHCRADADPATRTSPLLRDTDRGGATDGSEDANLDGKIDAGETDPTAGHGADDATVTDTDGDGLSDKLEATLGSNPNDADTDDDGLLDGSEHNPSDDHDGDGTINVRDPDSDGDRLFDGTEAGKDCSNAATDTSKNQCIADADPATETGVLNADTDKGGVKDGDEDTNRNGKVDPGERDPRVAADDNTGGDAGPDAGGTDAGGTDAGGDGGGVVADAGKEAGADATADSGLADTGSLEGGGCSCTTAGGDTSDALPIGVALALAGVLVGRRRRPSGRA